MDYEKKYKEIVGKIRKAYLYAQANSTKAVLEEILPELKESEDERIRKAIIEMIHDTPSIECENYRVSKEDVLAWLEKQGDEKSADKIEPKFHKGEWVIINGHVLKITEIRNDLYETIFQNDELRVFDTSVIDNEAHLWTIQDAKDGDVLVDAYGNIGVCEKTDSSYWTSYCFMWESGVFADFGALHENDKTYPATKEQRDTLFKAMADEGYEFDFETKKLNRIRIK